MHSRAHRIFGVQYGNLILGWEGNALSKVECIIFHYLAIWGGDQMIFSDKSGSLSLSLSL